MMGDALRILLVEDEALVAMLVEDALVLHGHIVTGIADTRAEALALAEADRPDLALCDVRLAHGDCGRGVAATLAERGIPCLFLSGNCPDVADHPLILGCVAKPFQAAALDRVIDAVLVRLAGKMPERVPAELRFY
ncbi:response regulator [uncultured Sphingomonas sp.]|uniref:response regulator n=1 Tax=uncultured Sphingomonas sp. TaxID=158754 RepID=UPI0025D0845A|nr:response regulator [uncultured Sphingomonas sp.]